MTSSNPSLLFSNNVSGLTKKSVVNKALKIEWIEECRLLEFRVLVIL